jgi:hypothetical protein
MWSKKIEALETVLGLLLRHLWSMARPLDHESCTLVVYWRLLLLKNTIKMSNVV